MDEETLFLAKFSLYQCGYDGVFSITEDVHRLIRATSEDEAIKKLKGEYKNTEIHTFQVLNAIVSRIIT